ncbi:MAG: hypothetical protein PVF74_11850 [Anaerolineales bacterium]|jgi:hypothetical protein
MSKTNLVEKLRIRPGQKVLILNAPTGYIDSLSELPKDVDITEKPEGSLNLVHLFVTKAIELEEPKQTAINAIAYDGLFWISYSKKCSKMESDLSRDIFGN